MRTHRRNAASLSMIAITTVALACKPAMDSQCHTSQDCDDGLFCQMGMCTDLNTNSTPGAIPLGQSDAALFDGGGYDGDTGDADSSEPTHPCPEAPPASQETLVLNEFLANVPMGLEGDANGDGVRHYHDDEFVELVNIGDHTIDVTSVTLSSDTTQRFTFPEFCLDPMHAVVVFGGLEPGSEPPQGEGFTSLISDSWFRYPQGGGRVVIHDAHGNVVADVSYGSHPDGSLNLSQDLSGTSFSAHRDIAPDSALFSPGKCANGQPFPTGCIDEEDEGSDGEDDEEQQEEQDEQEENEDSPFADSKPTGD